MIITPPRPICLRLFAIGGLVFGGLALLAAGCDKHTLTVARPASAADLFTLTADWPAFAQTGKADILFMVDDSSAMVPTQQTLIDSFSAFADVLANLPSGMPDLHVGVVSSSMGAGLGIERCDPGGDQGLLHNAPVGSTCGGVALTDMYLAAHVDATTHQLVTNFGPASLADALGCIAALGDQGCGFEHQFASVLRALGADGAAAPVENAGFLRDDALLAIVMVTNEDDCSAPPDTGLFALTSRTAADPLGPLTSYRCNEYGHVCLLDGKLQAPPRDRAVGPLEGCRSAEAPPLLEVADVVTKLQKIKSDPARIYLAAVAGPTKPYSVALGPSLIAGDTTSWPHIEHSCQLSSGTFGDPAVRIAQAVDAFGDHGTFFDVCSPTFQGVLNQFANAIALPLETACVAKPTPGGPGCTVVDRWVGPIQPDGERPPAALRVPSCTDPVTSMPCFRLVDDPSACAAGRMRLEVERYGTPVPDSLVTAVDCTAAHP
jgi:hypothetical protein